MTRPTTERTSKLSDNPMLVTMWLLTGVLIPVGLVASTIGARYGRLLLDLGALMLIASLVAGAVCWQIGRSWPGPR